MKHLIQYYKTLKSWIISIPNTLEKQFTPIRYQKKLKQGERILLIKQLKSSIEADKSFRKVSGRRGNSFASATKDLEVKKRFLEDITKCSLEDFEYVATKWMNKTRRLR